MAFTLAFLAVTPQVVVDPTSGQTFRFEELYESLTDLHDDLAARDEIWAEGAWLRHAESAGFDEAHAERQWEDARGVVQYEDARDAAMGRA